MHDRFNLRIGGDGPAVRTSPRRWRSSFPLRPQSAGSGSRSASKIEEQVRPGNVKPPDVILLPLDVHKCSLEAFSYINQFAEHRTTVILLHVINLNVLPPDGRVFDELCRAAEKDLQRLSQKFLDPRLCLRHEVRFGKPADGIVDEARKSNVDLIALTTYGNSSFWQRPFHPQIVQKVLRSVDCDVMLLHVRTRFDCEDDWLYINEIASAMKDTGLFNFLTKKFQEQVSEQDRVRKRVEKNQFHNYFLAHGISE